MAENRNLEVVFFDVGQGDSVFIETPSGHQIIIDGGPNSELISKLGSRMPFWDKTIDVVILTHPEKDHMTGLLDLLARYKIDYFVWTGVKNDNAENKKLAELLEKAKTATKNNFLASLSDFSGTKVFSVSAGDKIRAGSALFSVLFPLEDFNGEQVKSTNDTSIVLKLTFTNNKFIFTGDISASVEKKLAESGIDLSADVLKVSHHGSKYSTSEEFLTAVNPELAVISAGRNNPYGHPTQEVLDRLEGVGVRPLRTDQIGDITMLLDGNNVYIK